MFAWFLFEVVDVIIECEILPRRGGITVLPRLNCEPSQRLGPLAVSMVLYLNPALQPYLGDDLGRPDVCIRSQLRGYTLACKTLTNTPFFNDHQFPEPAV